MAAALLLITATQSAATSYHSVRHYGGGLTGTVTVTTDGALGVLAPANILTFQLGLAGLGDDAANYGSNPTIFATGNQVVLQGASLSATPTRLFFDFDSGGGIFGTVSGGYYLLTAADCTLCDPGGEFVELDPEFSFSGRSRACRCSAPFPSRRAGRC
ncbi:hypothetical protein IP88_03830 [alpha proteobacterium AAP81b]|nr:hypothetical protein IP88_03830 [alpha proteobacterium AAP81b]